MHIHAPLKFLQKLYKQMPVDSWHLRKAPEISAKSKISIGYTKHISEHLSLLHYSVRKFKYLHEFLLPPVIFIKVSYIWGDIFYYSWFLFADLNSCQCFCLSVCLCICSKTLGHTRELKNCWFWMKFGIIVPLLDTWVVAQCD